MAKATNPEYITPAGVKVQAPPHLNKPKSQYKVFNFVNGLIFILVCLIIIVPIWKVLIDSLDLTTGYGLKILPTKFGLDGYASIFSNQSLLRPLWVSIYTTVAGTFLGLLLSTMGAYVLMLHFGLVPDEDKNRFESQLVSLLEQNGNRLDTGFLATPYLLPALTEMGRKDLAASLLFQTKMPSWLYEVEQGATAIWESWDAVQPGEEPAVTSYDHYAFGCADAWVFEQVAGIRMIKPGFKEITVCPEPGLFPLTECERTFMSEYGEIAVHWDQNTLNLTIPCGVTAQVVWKGINRTVGSGTYTFGRGENEQ